MSRNNERNPIVEIAIAAHNAGRYLRESVRSALGQTYSNIVVTVVDDGSTDNSLETLADIDDPRLRLLRQAHAGKAAALNRILDNTQADFLAVQDADDHSHPRRIERLVAAMCEHSNIAAVFSGHELIVNDSIVAPRARAKSPQQIARDIDAMRMPAHDPTMMFRLSMVRDVRFEETLFVGQGYDHILRVGERLPMLVLGECLYSYRVHRTSNTQRQINRRIDFVLRIIERACQRRGLTGRQTQVRISQELCRLQHGGPLNNIAAHMLESVVDQRNAGNRFPAFRSALVALRLQPLSKHHYKPMLAALAPRFILNAWQNRRALPTSEFKADDPQAIVEIKPDASSQPESCETRPQQKAQTHV